MNCESLTLRKEYEKLICNKHTVRIYTTAETYNDETKYRWHIGFPRSIVPDGFATMLSTTPFVGEEYWIDNDDYRIWWVPCLTTTDEFTDEVKQKLHKFLRFFMQQHNMCLAAIKKWTSDEDRA